MGRDAGSGRRAAGSPPIIPANAIALAVLGVSLAGCTPGTVSPLDGEVVFPTVTIDTGTPDSVLTFGELRIVVAADARSVVVSSRLPVALTAGSIRSNQIGITLIPEGWQGETISTPEVSP